MKNRPHRTCFVILTFVGIMLLLGYGVPAVFAQPQRVISPDEIRRVRKEAKVTSHLNQMAQTFLEEGRLLEATSLLKKACQLCPQNPQSTYLLALTYINTDNERAALSLLEQASKYNSLRGTIQDVLDDLAAQYQDKKASAVVSIAPFLNNKRAAITFCFDDGPDSVYEIALPVFDRYGFHATIALAGVMTHEDAGGGFGSWRMWQDAARRGHEIANHSLDHGDLTNQEEPYLERSINGMNDLIRDEIGVAPRSFIFPFDKWDAVSLGKVRERHTAIRATEYLTHYYEHVFCPILGGRSFRTDHALHYFDFARQGRFWLILECHAMNDEQYRGFQQLEAQTLDEMLAFLRENPDDFWVDTFDAIFEYERIRKNTEIDFKRLPDQLLAIYVKPAPQEVPAGLPLTVVVHDPQIRSDNVLVLNDRQERLRVVRSFDGGWQFNVDPVPGLYYLRWQ